MSPSRDMKHVETKRWREIVHVAIRETRTNSRKQNIDRAACVFGRQQTHYNSGSLNNESDTFPSEVTEPTCVCLVPCTVSLSVSNTQHTSSVSSSESSLLNTETH